jgi:hypothetical protein
MRFWFVFPLTMLLLSPYWLGGIETRVQQQQVIADGDTGVPPHYSDGGGPIPPHYADGGGPIPPH